MKLYLLTLCLALFLVATLAAAPQKQVIITYATDTPDSVLEDAKRIIKEAVRLFYCFSLFKADYLGKGGVIIHEYGTVTVTSTLHTTN